MNVFRSKMFSVRIRIAWVSILYVMGYGWNWLALIRWLFFFFYSFLFFLSFRTNISCNISLFCFIFLLEIDGYNVYVRFSLVPVNFLFFQFVFFLGFFIFYNCKSCLLPYVAIPLCSPVPGVLWRFLSNLVIFLFLLTFF